MKQAHPGPTDGEPDTAWLDGIIDRGLTPTVATDYERWQPLHWVLEAPDVIVERGGFDAIVGNPPFLGGQEAHRRDGHERARLVRRTCSPAGRRAMPTWSPTSSFGRARFLRADGDTRADCDEHIAQGDTREVGLDQLVDDGFDDHAGDSERGLAGASANLEYAAVWGTSDAFADDVPRVCDGVSVRGDLDAPRAGGRGRRATRSACVRTQASHFKGAIVLGMGSSSSPTRPTSWIADDPRNA